MGSKRGVFSPRGCVFKPAILHPRLDVFLQAVKPSRRRLELTVLREHGAEELDTRGDVSVTSQPGEDGAASSLR